MQSSAWGIQGVDIRDGGDLVLRRLVAWGAGGEIVPVSITSTYPPVSGSLDFLLNNDGLECAFSSSDLSQVNFKIEMTFDSPVELYGFRFAGPSEKSLPVRHTLVAQERACTVGAVQWVEGGLSPAPKRQPSFYAPAGEWTNFGSIGTSISRAAIAASEGGRVLLVGAGTALWLSLDGGSTWATQTTVTTGTWYKCHVSDDGSVLFAIARSRQLYVSRDGGATWVAQGAPGSSSWESGGGSRDGLVLMAAIYGGSLWMSKDAGLTWAANTAAGSRNWQASGVSGDGLTIVGCPLSSAARISRDGGVTWVVTSTVASNWTGCALSNDGHRILLVGGGIVYLSLDHGVTWTNRASSISSGGNWSGCAMSADGSVMMIGATGGKVWVSQDGGDTWVEQSALPTLTYWYGCAITPGADMLLASGPGTNGFTAFLIPDDAYTEPPVGAVPLLTGDLAARGIDISSQGALSTVCVEVSQAVDLEFGGDRCIYGTVELYAQSGKIPLPRRVRLHRSRDGLLVRETWSNAQGVYRFDGISERYTYDVIAWDHEGLQQSVVANDLTPEVMP